MYYQAYSVKNEVVTFWYHCYKEGGKLYLEFPSRILNHPWPDFKEFKENRYIGDIYHRVDGEYMLLMKDAAAQEVNEVRSYYVGDCGYDAGYKRWMEDVIQLVIGREGGLSELPLEEMKD